MFVKVQKKKAADGTDALYASVVENHRKGNKVMQRTVTNIGRVDPEQVPYLKAAWAKDKPRLIWD